LKLELHLSFQPGDCSLCGKAFIVGADATVGGADPADYRLCPGCIELPLADVQQRLYAKFESVASLTALLNTEIAKAEERAREEAPKWGQP
jgi:hypothetical protein